MSKTVSELQAAAAELAEQQRSLHPIGVLPGTIGVIDETVREYNILISLAIGTCVAVSLHTRYLAMTGILCHRVDIFALPPPCRHFHFLLHWRSLLPNNYPRY